MRRSLLAISAAAVLLAGACGTARPHSAPDPTVATVTIPTTSPTTTSPSVKETVPPASNTTSVPTTTIPVTAVVPARITVAYVDEVLAKLNHVYGDAVRATVAAHRLTDTAIADISSIYSAKLGAEEQTIFIQAVRSGLKDIRKHPGDPVTRVLKIISASTSCIYARVTTNADATAVRPVKPPADEFVGLQRRTEGSVRLDPTPWMIFFDLTNATPTNVPDQC